MEFLKWKGEEVIFSLLNKTNEYQLEEKDKGEGRICGVTTDGGANTEEHD